MVFLIPTVPANAVNSVDDGKWDFTITDVRASQNNDVSEDYNMSIEVEVSFEGTEDMGTTDVMLAVGNDSVTKTISNIQQENPQWAHFEYFQDYYDDCNLSSAKVMVTAPGFRDEHVFDEKVLFFVPSQECDDLSGFSDVGDDNVLDKEIEHVIEYFGLSHDILELYKGKIQYVTIYGNVAKSKYLQGHDLIVLMTRPDGTQDELHLQVTSDGKFESVLRFDFDHSIPGQYTFEPRYMEKYRAETIQMNVTKSLS